MSEDNEKEETLPDEDLELLRQHVHQGLATTVTFAEIINLVNNLLVSETEERINKLNLDGQKKEVEHIKKSIAKAEAEAEAEAKKNQEDN